MEFAPFCNSSLNSWETEQLKPLTQLYGKKNQNKQIKNPAHPAWTKILQKSEENISCFQ